MNNRVLFSVIVPVYNSEQYIKTCVESVLKQSLNNFELILIDDGSSDSSLSVCKELAAIDSRVVVIHQDNAGVSAARNAGIKAAKGEYLAFIDSDDTVSPEYLKNLYQNGNFDYVVSGFEHCKMKGTEKKTSETKYLDQCGDGINNLPNFFWVNGVCHSACGKLYRCSIVLDNCITFPNTRLSEDTFFNLSYLQKACSWAITSNCDYTYYHRESDAQATKKYVKGDEDIYIRLYQEMKKLGIDQKIINSTIYAQYLSINLRVLRTPQLSRAEKKEIITRNIWKKGMWKILLFTKRPLGEWITGGIVCTGSVSILSFWEQLIR